MKKFSKKTIFIVILIFCLSLAVRYWPILHKGFSSGVSANELILARNLSLTGEYKLDSEKNVVLSSGLVKEQGIQSKFGNKLTPILYAKAFDVFGFNPDFPLYIALGLYGIVSVLLFLLVLKLFNIWVALLFSFFEVFSPLVLQNATSPGLYEWAVLFLAIALLIYLWKEKPNLLKCLLAGLFFALASLARNSFLIIPVVFLIYDFWKNRSFKRVIIFVLPLLVLWGAYLGPDFVKQGMPDNSYLSSKETTSTYMHIFPDPYTWHFERDAYAESVRGNPNYDYTQFLSGYGYVVSLKNKILMYWASITSYPKGLVAQTILGGPFLVFFLILGGFYLYKSRKELLNLFVLWAGFLYVLLIVFAINNWGQLTSLQLPLILLISLGVYWIIQFVLKQDFKNIFKYLLVFGFIAALFLHLIQSDKWMFHENYLYSGAEETFNLIKIFEKEGGKLDKKTDVVAIGLPAPAPQVINYYTDFSCVRFAPETIQKLLKENKLKWAFGQFGITALAGYDKDLTEKIIKAVNLKVIM